MDIPTAKSQRAALISRLNTFVTWADSDEMRALDFYELKAKMDRYAKNFQGLEQANAIVAGAAETPDLCGVFWTEFHGLEDRYAEAEAKINKRAVELMPVAAPIAPLPADDNAGADAAAAQPAPQNIIVHMPFQPQHVHETWGTFNGDPLQWNDFRARFELAVHNRPEIPLEYKFSYLRNALVGKAAQATGGWILRPENYAKVWDELVAKNNQRYPLACAYLSRFFANKQLEQPTTPDELQRLVNEANTLVRQLTDMNYPVEHMNLIIVHAIQERLNKFYADKWESERNGNDEPTVQQITTFLESLATRSANQGLAYSATRSTPANDRSVRSRLGPVVPRSTPPVRSSGASAYPCSACGQSDGHLVFDCPEFKPVSLSERMRIVLHNRMCMNCLKRGHQKDNCHDQHRCPLPECRGDNRHNSMLCPIKNDERRVTVATVQERLHSTTLRRDRASTSGRSGEYHRRSSLGKRDSDSSA